jgi:hypothetical protein
MSKFVKVKTQLRDLALVKQSLDDLKLDYQADAVYAHPWSGFRGTVPFVIRQHSVAFGLRATDDGGYEVIADDMQMPAIRPLMERIQQRYAYHAVLQETARAGFELVEENVGRDQVIRLTVRRWS